MDLTYDTIPARQLVAGSNLRRCQDAIVRYVVERAYRSGAPTGHEGHEAGKGVGGPRSCGTGVIHARFAESREGWACAGSHTIFVVDRVHSIDADQQHMPAAEMVVRVVPILRARNRSERDGGSNNKRERFR